MRVRARGSMRADMLKDWYGVPAVLVSGDEYRLRCAGGAGGAHVTGERYRRYRDKQLLGHRV